MKRAEFSQDTQAAAPLRRALCLAFAVFFLVVSGCDLTGGYQQRIEEAGSRVGRQAVAKPQPAAVPDEGQQPPADENNGGAVPAPAADPPAN